MVARRSFCRVARGRTPARGPPFECRFGGALFRAALRARRFRGAQTHGNRGPAAGTDGHGLLGDVVQVRPAQILPKLSAHPHVQSLSRPFQAPVGLGRTLNGVLHLVLLPSSAPTEEPAEEPAALLERSRSMNATFSTSNIVL